MSDEKELGLESMLTQPNLPLIYANGFVIFQTNADIGVVLRVDNTPVSVLRMSFTLAKTLGIKLDEVIGNLETKTNQEILTTQVIQTKTFGSE